MLISGKVACQNVRTSSTSSFTKSTKMIENQLSWAHCIPKRPVFKTIFLFYVTKSTKMIENQLSWVCWIEN